MFQDLFGSELEHVRVDIVEIFAYANNSIVIIQYPVCDPAGNVVVCVGVLTAVGTVQFMLLFFYPFI